MSLEQHGKSRRRLQFSVVPVLKQKSLKKKTFSNLPEEKFNVRFRRQRVISMLLLVSIFHCRSEQSSERAAQMFVRLVR